MDEWTNPEQPPVVATDLGDGVYVSWGSVYNDDDKPLIWHWCNRAVLLAEQRTDVESWWLEPRWMVTGVGAHQLVSREPLHLEPSLHWPACCGKHGFIRAGQWAGV